MAIEERPELEKRKQEADSTEACEVIPAEVKEPAVPKSMSNDEVQRVRSQAIELVNQLEDATGSKELAMLDGITNVGLQAQRNAAGQLELLKTRVGTFLNQGGTSAEIADGLRDLRVNLSQINPHEMTQPGIKHRLFGVLPFFKGPHNPVLTTLNRIALRYEPVSRQITHIETKLRDGQVLLARDNLELRKLYEDVETQQPPIQRSAYLGELLIQHLSQMLEKTDDHIKRDRIQDALHDVTSRVQDMREMEEVHIQFFLGIEMSWQNNNRLGQSVERTLALATNVVTVGLAIQSALIRQKRVMEANVRTREFLGNLVAANAGAIRQHTQEIGDLYNNPVISMEKITQAHNDLIEALNTASRLRQEGIDTARENIATLSHMSAKLEQKVSGILRKSESRPGSVEA